MSIQERRAPNCAVVLGLGTENVLVLAVAIMLALADLLRAGVVVPTVTIAVAEIGKVRTGSEAATVPRKSKMIRRGRVMLMYFAIGNPYISY
ncbi:MAG: hypothetical protein HY644_00725 [Acidobacteria bacterium]|nr:hypothetical protein [Acidobacteriota bacterium]